MDRPDGSGLTALPLPSWVTQTVRGFHATWALAHPVGKHPKARGAPLRLFLRVGEYFLAALGADPSFAGLTRSPVHHDTEWLREQPYELRELADVVPKGWRKPPRPRTEYGRNCSVFLETCRRASTSALPAVEIAKTLDAGIAADLGKRPLAETDPGELVTIGSQRRAIPREMGDHRPQGGVDRAPTDAGAARGQGGGREADPRAEAAVRVRYGQQRSREAVGSRGRQPGDVVSPASQGGPVRTAQGNSPAPQRGHYLYWLSVSLQLKCRRR